MSQAAASGRKNRPGEDEEIEDQWKQPHQQRMPLPQTYQEHQIRREGSALHQQTPQTLPNRQGSNDHLQVLHHYAHHQRNITPYASPPLTRPSDEQLRESYSLTRPHQVGQASVSAQRSISHSYPLTKSPKPWGLDQAQYPPRPSSATYLPPNRDDDYQMHKRRRISDDEESYHSEEGDVVRRSLDRRRSSRRPGRSQYPHYPSPSMRVDDTQSHQMLPPLSSQGLAMRSSQLAPSRHSPPPHPPPPPPPPPPPASLIRSNSVSDDAWRTQFHYTSTTGRQHDPGYSYPATYGLSPKLSSPPQGHPPPPLPPPPPPPPRPASNSTRDMAEQFQSYQSHMEPSPYQRHHVPPLNPDIESQYFRLGQENQYLRDKLHRATSEFIPGNNLRGVVAQLFEVVEDYAEVIATQQQQVQDALDAMESARTGENTGGNDELRMDNLAPRRKAVSDKNLMTQDSVVTCLRGMHTTMRSKLNTLKHVGDMKAKVSLLERCAAERGGASLERQEGDALIRKISWLEQERAQLKEKVEALEARQSKEVTSRRLLPQTSDSCLPNTNSPHLSISGSQPPSPNRQPPKTPTSPSTVTIAPSTAPSSAIYNETLTSLQHRLSVTQLELETLQSDHTRLRAALQRSQQRATTLEKKLRVSGDENDTIATDRDRFQMLCETLEEQLAEVTASKDEYHRQAVAGGAQYSAILANSTRLELMGVEDRKRWKEEREGLEKEKAELSRLIVEQEKQVERLRGEMEMEKSRGQVGAGVSRAEVRGVPLEQGNSLAKSVTNGIGDTGLRNDIELNNQYLLKRVQNLEKIIREMKREGLGVLRAAERLLAAGESLE